MSTDRSRLVSSIRRIVLTDPDLSSALDAWQNRGDQASSTGVGTSDAERDRLCCDGSTSDNPNPGADTRDTSEGEQDGLDPDDPADISDMGGGCLSGVTDCATGEAVCFCGGDWIPPEGWDSPTDPPTEDGYEEGTYWNAFSDNREEGRSSYPQGASDLACNFPPCCAIFEDPGWGHYDSAGGEGDCGRRVGAIFSHLCDGDTSDYCTEVPYEDWPEDGCTNLAIKNGTIVGSKYDPENDGTYSKPMDEIQLCSGGDQIGLKPAKTGLYKTLNSTTDSGYLYNSQHEKIAHIDGNEYADPDI